MRGLKEFRIRFEPVARSAVPSEEDLGLRSKLGGKPEWEQADETPSCPRCHQQMVFVGQIDSIEFDSAANPHRVDCLSGEAEYMFGDVGLIYVFFCFECCESQSVFQCQ